ncbi:hypothetical protein F5884DRAFT_764316 [Xylogone sp. PMI_703]|nr:hypothetical protein F5884DRAFT_764316 [Xylogone sp. PMI_703]
MSYGVGSDEVAEDYRKALEDLTMNSRYEISNLTIIAKENTEHAFAIAEALKNHIKQTSPQKKLPALYVLDSVVKNVGTPYTLFFGRQLYSTFMEAYALVDNNVRRKMDEMLKTWKEPVPGSMDTQPVFPPEITRPIENALIKARTSAVQAHQEHLRNQQQLLGRGRQGAPYRDTPTPPNAVRQPAQSQPAYMTYNQPYQGSPNGQQYPAQANGNHPYGLPQVSTPPSYTLPVVGSSSWQQSQSQGYRGQDASIDALNSDIANLITVSKADFSQNPWDSSIQTRLKALLDLQTILQSQTLPPEQIALIRDQVAQLSEAAKPSPRIQTPPTHVPTPTPVAAPQPPAQQPTLASLLGPGALAALLARQSASSQAPTPPSAQVQAPAPAVVSVPSPRPQPAQPQYVPPPAVPPANPVIDASSLLEKLRAAGMLPAVPQVAKAPPVTHSLPQSIPQPPILNNTSSVHNLSRPALAEIPNDVVLKPASLKIPRPHLIANLYERLGAPCTQCGRRFQADEEGRKKKTAHMDWHFRVHQRMAEAEKRGQHRSWYVDELDWIKSREVEEEQNNNSANGVASGGNASSSTSDKPKLQYIAVPNDPALANSVCPICQEKFDTNWLADAQEWVWMDAKKVGDRIYHASCYAEVSRGGGSSQIKTGTPEPVLGKRKAEDDLMTIRAKIKTEPVS